MAPNTNQIVEGEQDHGPVPELPQDIGLMGCFLTL